MAVSREKARAALEQLALLEKHLPFDAVGALRVAFADVEGCALEIAPGVEFWSSVPGQLGTESWRAQSNRWQVATQDSSRMV